MGHVSTKIDATERLLNLVIALLGTRLGRSKGYIRENINGYTAVAATAAEEAKVQPAFERMFERDKKTLLELGIPIRQSEVQGDDAAEQVLYRIDPVDYRVPEIRLDQVAMNLVSIAANLWVEATLGAAAQSALRKIAVRSGTGWYEDETTSQSRIRTAEPAFEPMWTALRSSHPVTFNYRRSGSTQSSPRTVQPLGLGNKYGQWYLAAWDLGKSEQRSFRLSRITSKVQVHATDTFVRTAGFTIASVLDKLGTGELHTAQIAVPQDAAHALRGRSGTEIQTGSAWSRPGWDVLRVSYREPELMADDVASLGDQALVLDPADLREAVVMRLHAAAAAAISTDGMDDLNWGTKMAPSPAKKKDTRDRLIRLLSMVPFLVANPGVDEAEVMAEFAITAAQWAKDKDTLNVTGLPGYYHGDLMDVTTEAGQVFIRDAETLASPLRLTQEEASSVLIGLRALTAIPDSQQARALEQAISSLTTVAGNDAWLADAVGLELVSGQEMGTIAALQDAIAKGRACAITYLVRSRDELSQRTIEPRKLFSVDAAWYVRAWCRKTEELRSFRLDHIKDLADAGAQENLHASLTPWQPTPGVYDPGSNDVQVQLIAEPTTALRLAPAYNAILFDLGADMVGLRLLVGDTATLSPLMARLGGRARVVEPQAVRQATADWLIAAAESCDAVGETTPAVPSTDG
ncbi:transcriptional regulator [Arthrobacter alpinus]|uniref:Transcriptional regulator n=1 Tax=Arthrobacter alpinus TaxID=656366 RepID=A0A1H5IYK6_9MICC|nr:transcriptional regulator [Arthrobacter alpinus]